MMRSTTQWVPALFAATALVVAGCAAIQQQKAIPPKTQGSFKNLKLFPANITHDDLVASMRGYTRALGVRCEHCHVEVGHAAEGQHAQMDFASDAKPEKEVARIMMVMTRDLNDKYISRVNEFSTDVQCITCHRGKGVPDQNPIPAVPAAGTAAAAPAVPRP